MSKMDYKVRQWRFKMKILSSFVELLYYLSGIGILLLGFTD
jgi:hypothetical protein